MGPEKMEHGNDIRHITQRCKDFFLSFSTYLMSVTLFQELLLVTVNHMARVLAPTEHTVLLGEKSRVNSNCIIGSKRKSIEVSPNLDQDLTKGVLREVCYIVISHVMQALSSLELVLYWLGRGYCSSIHQACRNEHGRKKGKCNKKYPLKFVLDRNQPMNQNSKIHEKKKKSDVKEDSQNKNRQNPNDQNINSCSD